MPIFDKWVWGSVTLLLASIAATGALQSVELARQHLQQYNQRFAIMGGVGCLALAYWAPNIINLWWRPPHTQFALLPILLAVLIALIAASGSLYWLSQRQQTARHQWQAAAVTGLGMLISMGSAHLALDVSQRGQPPMPAAMTSFGLISTACFAITLAYASVRLRHACLSNPRIAPWRAVVGGGGLGLTITASDWSYQWLSRVDWATRSLVSENSVFQPIERSYLWFVMVLGAFGMVCAMAVHRMLKRQQQLRRDLEFKEQQMRVIFQNAIDAIVITDHRGVIQTVNRSFEGLFGFKAQYALGKHVSMLIPEWHAMNVPNKLRRQTDISDQWVVERSGKHANGHEIPLRIALVYVQEHEQDLYVGFLMDMTQFRKQQRELEKLLTEDPLTGLFNRRGLLNVMQSTIAQNALRQHADCQYGMMVLFIDLDGFKAINDQYGHAAGDAVLIAVGQRIHQSVREEDTVCRFGGDEFVILLKFLQQPEKVAEHVIKKITQVINAPLTLANGQQVRVGCSIGVSYETAEQLGNNEVLLDKADTAMYQAKKAGGQRVVYFN